MRPYFTRLASALAFPLVTLGAVLLLTTVFRDQIPGGLARALVYLPYATAASALAVGLFAARSVPVAAGLTVGAAFAFVHTGVLPGDAIGTLGLAVTLNLALLAVTGPKPPLSLRFLWFWALLAAESVALIWLASHPGSAHAAWARFPMPAAARELAGTSSGAVTLTAFAATLTATALAVRPTALRGALAGATAAWLLMPRGGPLASALFAAAATIPLTIATLQHAHQLAYRDELTGLPGRRALNERLAGLGRVYTIAMVDVDHFKRFNDTYGHDVGDQVLRMVAGRLRSVGGGGRTYRYGGEEFTVVFPRREAQHAGDHLEALRQAVAEYRMTLRAKDRPAGSRQGRNQRGRGRGDGAVSVTVSIGVAERTLDRRKPEQVIKAADQALYRAKKAGRNRVAR